MCVSRSWGGRGSPTIVVVTPPRAHSVADGHVLWHRSFIFVLLPMCVLSVRKEEEKKKRKNSGAQHRLPEQMEEARRPLFWFESTHTHPPPHLLFIPRRPRFPSCTTHTHTLMLLILRTFLLTFLVLTNDGCEGRSLWSARREGGKGNTQFGQKRWRRLPTRTRCPDEPTHLETMEREQQTMHCCVG